MKPSETLQESLGPLASIATTGDLRRMVANAMLALVRKEITRDDLATLASGLDSISASLQAEVRITKLQIEMRANGGALANAPTTPGLGQLSIGSSQP